MTVYLVAKIEITDRSEYARYEAGFAEVFSKYQGRALSVDEDPTVLEGEWSCTRTVVLEFPSEASAMEWYESPEYQAIAKHRFAASTADVAIVRGMERRTG